MVRIVRIGVKVSVKRVSVSVRLRVSGRVSRIRVRMGTENSACHVYLSVQDGK